MNIKIIAAILLICSPMAFSAQNPAKSRYDNRMQYLSYNANDVTTIKAKAGFATLINFSEKETISDIAVGFQQGWEVVDSANKIFIKPKAYQADNQVVEPQLNIWDTNLLVTTNLNIYSFDLILLEESSKDNAYVVRFSYPEDKKELAKKQAAEAKAEAEKVENNIINLELNKLTTPKNWDYTMKVAQSSESIVPDFAYDDGVRTYIGFLPNKSIPTINYYQGNDEMMSNQSVKKQGNYSIVVIHKVAPRYILRSGDQVVGLINNGFGKVAVSGSETSNSKIIIEEK
ncbi:P-type conjugative transfer protein VirB9 [Providencia alcalifaciens]|uniref:P-type conjugative transfer protein VirB9 n=1 Tax=Providencia alcalifaciens TaxID=126385 RepID=UPI0032DB1D81